MGTSVSALGAMLLCYTQESSAEEQKAQLHYTLHENDRGLLHVCEAMQWLWLLGIDSLSKAICSVLRFVLSGLVPVSRVMLVRLHKRQRILKLSYRRETEETVSIIQTLQRRIAARLSQ